MKRLLFTTILLLLASPAWAWNWPVITAMQSGGGGVATCSGTYGNDATTDAGNEAPAADRIFLRKISIDCTGTPATINYRDKYNSGNVKFLIYSDDGGSPSAPDELLYTSSAVAVGSPSSNTTITDSGCDYQLSPGDYWVGRVGDSSGRIYYSSATGSTGVTYNFAGQYDTPPSSWNSETDTSVETDLEIWITF